MWQTLARTHRITKTGDVGHTTSLTLPLFIEVSLTSQESEWFILCQFSDHDFTSCSAIFQLNFKTVLTVGNFFNFHFISIRLRYNVLL
jgi:hypothetical protein